jgi:uncharacterized membrane protein
MAKDVSDVIGTAIGNAAREALENVSKNTHKKRSRGSSMTSTGVAAGAAGLGLMALAPVAGRGLKKLASGVADIGTDQLKGAGGKVQEKVTGKIQDKVKSDVKDAIPGSGLFSGGGLFSGSGDSDDDDSDGGSETPAGVGKGRRMPVQQDFDIGVPVSTVYNQWTQFEDWPKFMHRVTSVSQEDDTHVKFKTKIWGKTKEFTAEIVDQRPDERIKWRVVDGMSHSGVVTFHELGPRLTRVEVSLDIEPGSLIEKAARGMRHVKRAVRADMARFKAYVLMEEEETGEWRGQVEEGEVKSSSSGRSGSRSSQSGSGSRSSQSGSGSSSRRSRGATNGSSRSRSGSGSRSGRSRSGSHS